MRLRSLLGVSFGVLLRRFVSQLYCPGMGAVNLSKKGGIGLRALVYQNKVSLLKLGFQLLTNTEAFWVRILQSKYRVNGILPATIIRANCSFVWRSLSKVWLEVICNVMWAVGDGRTINFWNYISFHLHHPLKYFYLGGGLLNETLLVCDVLNSVGEWDWVCLRQWLPSMALNAIASLLPPIPNDAPDCMIWKWRDRDKFSTKATFNNLFEDVIPTTSSN